MRLAHTRLVTDDVPALARFYERITTTPAVGSEEYVQFQALRGGLAICSRRAMVLYGAGAVTAATRSSLIMDFEVEDVDAECARLAELVGELVSQPTTQPWGNRSMMFRDPDGHLVNFFTVVDERR